MLETGARVARTHALPAASLRRLVYRSRAAAPVGPSWVATLMRESRRRNRANGIGGVLVCDGGQFLQVLEGAPERIEHLSRALARDPRHGGMDILLDRPAAGRNFPDWDLELAGRHTDAAPLALGDGPLAALGPAPERLPDLLAEITRRAAGGAVRAWAPEEDTALRAEALLRLLIDSRGTPDPVRLDAWLADHVPGVRAFVALIEDTASALGALWWRDGCDGARVALALCALHGTVRRRLRQAAPDAPPDERGRVAVVATPPGESHVLGAILKAEILREAGWHVVKSFAVAGDPLLACVQRTEPAAVVIATSRVFPRTERAGALGAMVAAVRDTAAPGLRVVLGGAGWAAAPDLLDGTGADAACPSAALVDTVLASGPTLGAVA